jgi:predicted nucleotidyltransferase
MRREEIIAKLRDHEAELRAAGVASLALIGSVARGDDDAGSDIDVVVRFANDPPTGFAYFGRIDELSKRLQSVLGRSVDVIAEPVGNERLRAAIEKDRTVAF